MFSEVGKSPRDMIKRPQSRDSCTLFPAGYSSTSSITSERMGAFGTMQLEEPPRAHTPTRMSRGHPTAGYSPMVPVQNTPIMTTAGYVPGDGRRQNDYSAGPIGMKRPMDLDVNMTNPYHPTTVSNADTTETRRKYDKLTDVVSTSGDTVEFARNFNDYLNERIPYGITIGILAVLCIVAFIITLVGALNIPFCAAQPMIPIWLMVAGILFIISASIRMVRHIPDPPTRRRQTEAARKSRISTNLCVTGVEILFLGINLIWLICGCVWVYGARQYVHFRDQIFEEHYCDGGIYWTAFATVTGYIIFVCLLILMLICLLFVGSYKESQSEGSNR